jgi:hypothetical protein
MNEVRGPRIDAALRCYSLAARRGPGSSEADAAELAVLYTLSEQRDATRIDELVRDALHDGRRTVMRAARGRESIEQELAYLSAAGIDTAGARAASGAGAPEPIVFARELLDVLRRGASELGDPAPRVLAGMLVGETELDTARAVGISRSTVTRSRRALRVFATCAGYLPAARERRLPRHQGAPQS